ncbi:MAG TPA: glycosyltransferase family 39 protein [Candidatus Sulfotelmatobacter sp.]|nr:glycosyltransferase family 39 protein [Candidatus Sulfotelmatobacter sp.]
MDVINQRVGVEHSLSSSGSQSRADTAALLVIAGAIVLVHLLTNNRYGIHRDELQTLSDALHLDWGFVAYPPFTPFVERISLGIFGLSLVGLRLFSVIAQAAAVVVTGLMARELGGGRLAQATAALTVALSPLPLFEGTEFQYSTFDYLWWVLIAYFVIRLLKSEDPRWCLPIGATIGLGLMTKYTMCFYVAGIVGGLLLTPARRFFASKWFWAGIALALVICLPNLIWQARHDFISLHFLQHIHKRDVGQGRANGFWVFQFRVNANLVATPLWIAGLLWFLRSPRYRTLAWMYLIPLALFVVGKGRGYYVAGAYPMLLAMGAVAAERWVGALSRPWRWPVEGVFFAGLVAYGLYLGAMIVPVASGGALKEFALKNNGDLREEIGWAELVQAVAAVRDSLPAEQRENAGVMVGNYGEQGAIEMLGPAYRLPRPISLTNSAWLRGYPAPPPSTLIVVGWSRQQVDESFTSCRLAGHNGNPFGVENEESQDHQDIFVCGSPRKPWAEFWEESQRFG